MGAPQTAFEVGLGAVSPLASDLPLGPKVAPPAEAGPVSGMIVDMPDVLYDATLWRRWLLRLVNQLGRRFEYAEFYRDWDAHYLCDVNRGRREFGEAFQAFLLSVGLSWAQIDEVEAASRIQRRNLELNVRPLPGAAKALAGLTARGVTLVAWADLPFPAEKLAERLDRLTIGHLVSQVLSSFDLECVQPSPECYLAMLDALHLPTEECVYLGHDAAHLAGAKAAGMRTIAINYRTPTVADAHLAHLDELVPRVAEWSKCAGQQVHGSCSMRAAEAMTSTPGVLS